MLSDIGDAEYLQAMGISVVAALPGVGQNLQDHVVVPTAYQATENLLLLKTVEREPLDLGDEFGRWTAERLATYLSEQTGIELSSSQVRRILKRKKSPRFVFCSNKNDV